MADLLLYEHPLSPYVQKCKIALREKGLPFEARLPEGIGTGASGDAAFRRASPRGEVPALLHGETALFESTVILEYLEERWPETPLLPRAPEERARVRTIEDVMDTQFEPITWGLGEIRFFGRAEGALAEALTEAAGRQLQTWYRYLENRLGDREWFDGERFGRGDLSVVPYLDGARGFGFEPPAGTRLARWYERAHRRPSVAETAAEASASIPSLSQAAEWVRSGAMKREYRDHRLEWMIRSGGLQIVLDGLERDDIRFNTEFE